MQRRIFGRQHVALENRWGVMVTEEDVRLDPVGHMVGGELVRTLTVKKHLERILSKLGVENRTAAAGLILDQCTRMKVRIGG
jgi:ribulose 1,5-bisphosphate synthetase/thiazole synthase